MPSHDPHTPANRPTRELRSLELHNMGTAIGDALTKHDDVVLAYMLGRLDAAIGTSEEHRSYRRDERNLRAAICAGLDIYPDLTEPDPPTTKPSIGTTAARTLAAVNEPDAS